MKKWGLIALVIGGALFLCCSSVVVLGLVSDDGAPTGGGPRATAGCSSSIDGWQQEIGARGVVLTRADVTAELVWPFEITDALRAGDIELNVWAAAFGDRYEAGEVLQRGSYGELRLVLRATERSSGTQLISVFTTGAGSGVANAVGVFSTNESIANQYPGAGNLNALQQLNRFSLSCAEVEGRWKSGFSTAYERFSVSTGRSFGVTAAAAWRDMKLESGSYQRESSALLDGVFTKRKDSGDWSHDDWSLVLEPSGGEATRYNASFVAVQNGFLLKLQNQQFTGDIEEFQRVED